VIRRQGASFAAFALPITHKKKFHAREDEEAETEQARAMSKTLLVLDTLGCLSIPTPR
jgi:hypothetical protein